MPERLEQDEQHEDQPEDAGLEPRLLDEPVGGDEGGVRRGLAEDADDLAEPGRHRVARLRDRHRQERDEDRAEERAVQAAEPAHHHHQRELDRQQHAEDVGRHEADLVREERAAQPHQPAE